MANNNEGKTFKEVVNQSVNTDTTFKYVTCYSQLDRQNNMWLMIDNTGYQYVPPSEWVKTAVLTAFAHPEAFKVGAYIRNK